MPLNNHLVQIGISILGNGILNESDTLNLTCMANRTVNIMWTKQNKVGGSISILSNSSSVSESNLVITDVIGSDSGNYYCVAQSLITNLQITVNHSVHVNGNSTSYDVTELILLILITLYYYS